MSVHDTPENAGRCICPDCPTYDQCMGAAGLKLFCSRGKTDCDPKRRGCMCGDCPVWAENDLSDYYYCVEGAAE